MEDWVIPYLKDNNPEMPEKLLLEIKRANFDFFDEESDIFFGERHQTYDAYLDALEPLIDKLNCHFEPLTQFKCSNCQKFTMMFISVLASLSRDNFDKLCGSKNTFYIYSPASNAYVKNFEIINLKTPIDEKADLKVVVFNHEIATFPWFLGRFCIMRELGKIILGTRDEDTIKEKMKEWGFDKEMSTAIEFESRRREAISKFYAL